MQTENIYEERIFPKVEMYILGMVTVLLFFLVVYQLLVGHLVIDWLLLAMFLLFIVIMFNFRKFNIKMTSDSAIVNYGKANKRTIPWENINDCYLDKTSAIRYGGWGIRMGRVNGKWRDVYNVIGYPRVVLSLKDNGFFKEFVFSTKNPDEVMKIIKQQIDRTK